jgi:predicted acyltransferase
MVYSFRKRLSANPNKSNLWKPVFLRIFWLWVLGMMVQGKLLTYDIKEIKFYSNTLQAIAAGYLISAVLIMNLSVAKQIIATIGLMLVYWAIMILAPVPGLGSGLYTPQVNFALYFDKLVLGSFQDGTNYTWLVSSLNFGATTMLGVFTAYLLQSENKSLIKFYYLIIGGVTLIVLGQVWSLVHPSIKHIWTSSFVLFSGGICLLLLAFFFFFIDVLQFRKWTYFLIVIGSNAIFAYVSASIFDYRLIAKVFVGGLEKYTGDWYSFILAMGGFTVLFLFLRFMHKHKIFLKI